MDYAAFHKRSITDREGFWAEEAKLIDRTTAFRGFLTLRRFAAGNLALTAVVGDLLVADA